MKKLISIILTTALTLSMFSCANCFADKSTTAQSKIINAKTSSLNENRNAVDKVYGSIPRKTSILKKVLGATAAVSTSILGTFAVFKTFIPKHSNNQENPDVLNTKRISENTDDQDNPDVLKMEDSPQDTDTNSKSTSLTIVEAAVLTFLLACTLPGISDKVFAFFNNLPSIC